jgi:membrane-associated protease RseP (regulator of RpoE activity)
MVLMALEMKRTMRNLSSTRWVTAMLALAVALAIHLPAAAQDGRVTRAPQRGWIGISFRAVTTPAPEVIVEAVIAGAPAARAGILAGDRIVQWNGRTDVNAAIRGGTLEPGDTVRIRVRREGQRDRDVTVLAEARPGIVYGAAVPLEEFSRRLRIQSDSLRILADSMGRAFRLRGDSLRVYFDSTLVAARPFFRMQVDSLRRYELRADSVRRRAMEELRAQMDSLQVRLRSRNGSRGFPVDSMFLEQLERMREWTESNGFLTDSAQMRVYRWGPAAGSSFGIPFPDGQAGVGQEMPGFGISVVGGRSAVAGAQLTDVGPGLAAYFGTESGALVLRVAPGTPAARAGLAEGDVIVRAAGQAIANVDDVRRLLGRASAQTIELEIVRHRARQTLTIGR